MKKGKKKIRAANKSIGYIFYDKDLSKDEKLFLKAAKKNKVNLVMFNLAKELSEEEIEKKASKCDLIFNNSGEEFAVEIVKTLEELGKKVIDPSRDFYYIEDKWIFYLDCKKNKIPVPKTILLSENINLALKEIEEFGFPVVLKRISGTCGEYVKLAKNRGEAKEIINKFWNKGSQRIPIIAQELINSPCYRVTVIGDSIVQTAKKDANGWKKTGVYANAESIKKFGIDKELRMIIKNLIKISKINVCGVDLLKKDGKWIVLEVNSEPAFDFFPEERGNIIEKVVKYLKTY